MPATTAVTVNASVKASRAAAITTSRSGGTRRAAAPGTASMLRSATVSRWAEAPRCASEALR
ncbi:hypothetical protein HNQ79_005106 [Streptomyces candidus]|uniref:Uncharacterized protein n=1 Tax=Streptomyces candidus TaxID=67283 RepID=A0A7X0HJ32_9ACTN|nr:hypothetical protein [Streptomyces candidus]